MISKYDDGRLELRTVDGTWTRTIDLSGFQFVSAIRIDPTASRIALTGVPPGKRAPSLESNFKGDLALFVIALDSGEREILHEGYAHDPAWFPDGKALAFHSGQGISVVRLTDSRIDHTFKAGAFSWGPPSVSVSPDGSTVGFVKWKGDDRRLAYYDLATRQGRILKPSCFEYGWWDKGTLVYSLSNGIKLLDLSTERSTLFLKDATTLRKMSDLDVLLPAMGQAMESRAPFIVQDVGRPFVFDGRVYFILTVATEATRNQALCSLGLDKTDLRAHYTPKEGRITGYALINKGQTFAVDLEFYQGTRIVARKTEFGGKDADRVPSGFGPLSTSPRPESGFHYIGDPDQGT